MEIIKKIRAPIDKALDFLINWIVNAGKALYGKAKSAVKDWWKGKKPFTAADGEGHEISSRVTRRTPNPSWRAARRSPSRARLKELEGR